MYKIVAHRKTSCRSKPRQETSPNHITRHRLGIHLPSQQLVLPNVQPTGSRLIAIRVVVGGLAVSMWLRLDIELVLLRGCWRDIFGGGGGGGDGWVGHYEGRPAPECVIDEDKSYDYG